MHFSDMEIALWTISNWLVGHVTILPANHWLSTMWFMHLKNAVDNPLWTLFVSCLFCRHVCAGFLRTIGSPWSAVLSDVPVWPAGGSRLLRALRVWPAGCSTERCPGLACCVQCWAMSLWDLLGSQHVFPFHFMQHLSIFSFNAY